MHFRRNLGLALIFAALAASAPAAQVDQDQQQSLGDIARETRQNAARHRNERPDIKALVDQFNAEHANDGDTPQTSVDVSGLLLQHRYDELDKAAERMRANRSRTTGGIWQLYLFYDAVNQEVRRNPRCVGELQKWAEARPQSVTARVALAQAYVSVGFAARGTGYAGTVSDAGWTGLNNGADMALKELKEASSLGSDPDIYYVLMEVALAQGWDKQQTRQVFERALADEPGYYHTFREYANYLLPKWYGDEFDAENLGEELYQRVGGQEGLFMYFEIATIVGCDCADGDHRLQKMSWERVKEGYAALQELYGANNRDNNRFLRMAFTQGDKDAGKEAAQKINDWDSSVWRSQQSFINAKAWALAP